MGSATYPVLGSKYEDMRNRDGGEIMYVRGGAAARGDVKMAWPFQTDAAIDDDEFSGSTDSLMSNVEPVAAGTSDINLRFGTFRVCNQASGIVDDGKGYWLGKNRVLCKCKVNIASGGTIVAGTPFVPTAAQVYLSEADLTQDGVKVVAMLAYDQVLATGVNLAVVVFDGDLGFGPN